MLKAMFQHYHGFSITMVSALPLFQHYHGYRRHLIIPVSISLSVYSNLNVYFLSWNILYNYCFFWNVLWFHIINSWQKSQTGSVVNVHWSTVYLIGTSIENIKRNTDMLCSTILRSLAIVLKLLFTYTVDD